MYGYTRVCIVNVYTVTPAEPIVTFYDGYSVIGEYVFLLFGPMKT